MNFGPSIYQKSLVGLSVDRKNDFNVCILGIGISYAHFVKFRGEGGKFHFVIV